MVRNTNLVFLILLLTWVLSGNNGYAQQFGRNKPNYEKFDFKIHQSPNFELYHYLKNDSLVETFSSASELVVSQRITHPHRGMRINVSNRKKFRKSFHHPQRKILNIVQRQRVLSVLE